MKKVIYLLTILFAVVLINISCEKEDPVDIKLEKTLAEQYPDWTNLSWISTDGNDDRNAYPQFSITIFNNSVLVIQPCDSLSRYYYIFEEMSVNTDGTFTIGSTVGFYIYGTYVKNETQFTLITFGLQNKYEPTNEHTYVLE